MTPEELKQARQSLGLTIVQLAERLDVHWTSVSRWENGRQRIPQIVALAVAQLARQLVDQPPE